MRIKGVDLSYCQKGIDYKALAAAGVKFAIIRAGCSEAPDRELKSHVEGCAAAGIDVGYYWYSYARDAKQAEREAAACLKAIADFPKPRYPVFFDAEEGKIAAAAGRKGMTDIAVTFIEAVKRGGYVCGLYANPSWMEQYYDKAKIGGYDIWLAHWTGSPDEPTGFDYRQRLWQWGTEKIGGMVVDGDLCFAEYPETASGGSLKTEPAPLDSVAREVIRGRWGNGAERKRRLTAAGFDYVEVQQMVNEIMVSARRSLI